MMKRLSVGVLLLALGAMLATTAFAERPTGREWRGGRPDAMQNSGLPLFFRSTAGTTWVSVGQTCASEDTLNSSHSTDEVWCFDAGGFSWPDVPPAQNTGSSHEEWDHWSAFAPPIPPSSKWHVSTFDTGVSGGTYNAWAGCDSVGTNPGCAEVAFWGSMKGYGDNWNYSLDLHMDSEDASQSGGTIQFDLKYDTECLYDYLYLEYWDTDVMDPMWTAVEDSAGTPVFFNAVSGNTGGAGRACGDYFEASDQNDLGGNQVPWYGNSQWLLGVTFPLPTNVNNGIRLRWRAYSDGAWSDADGRGDTDGIGNLDNIVITFQDGTTVTDDFESGGLTAPGGTGTGEWFAGGLEGNTNDGWNMQFDPGYKNKGNTCNFSEFWMFASRPTSGGIPPEWNGFQFYLVSPVIDCDGWNGGVMEYANYMCAPDITDDYTDTHIRTFDSNVGIWGLWNDFDGGFVIFAGCEFWNMNNSEDASPFLSPSVDSLQFGYRMLDSCKDGDFCWNKHSTVTWLIDNVSIGSFDGSSTVFTARNIDLLADTYSRNDPAHSPFLQNAEQGMWPTRVFADSDSLNVTITDFDGVVAADVELVWRVSVVDPPVFGGWITKQMTYSVPDALANGDGGLYRGSIGNDLSEDYSPPSGDGLIWAEGTTVDYYVKVTDDATTPNVATFPAGASGPDSTFLRFEVLPFTGRTVGDMDERILIVDDYTRNFLDFENSTGFDPAGGADFGAFSDPVFDQPEDMIERALGLMYGIANPEDNPGWDIYDVQGAGSSVQCEPRVFGLFPKLGGIGDDLGLPKYDAVIWPNGSFDAYSFADTTRIHLETFLDAGGHLWSNGDEVAKFLGSGGDNADSTIHFVSNYMGISFPNIVDDATDSRVLNITGVASTSLDGVTLGVYGECPLRRAFDRLTESVATGEQEITTLANYSDGGAGDNGRAAIIKNVRLDGAVPTGVCIHSGFGLSALVSDASRATLLAKTFVTDFGLWDMSYVGVNNGVDAPVVTNSRFGFDLAQASPNPFATSTQIRFSVPNRAHVSIEVYNILGQRVRTLVDESMEANSYVREWDGRADTGERVSSGIYFYKMVAGDYSATRKTVLLK